MSSQQIPNLLTLRGGPRSRAGRGRGRGRGGQGSDHNSAISQRKDQDIQSTDTDAAVSRLSAVSLGYLEDQYATHFINGPGTRRLPIINRGTYTRTTALDILIKAFLAPADSGTKDDQQWRQIISLGAGTDTRYLRLRAANKCHNLIYHEFDFPSVSATKMRTVIGKSLLNLDDEYETRFPLGLSFNDGVTQDTEWGISSTKSGKPETMYCCHPLDLRDLPSKKQAMRGIRTDIPTLLISECCLCYLDIEISKGVVKWFTDRIPSLGIILYEPIGVHDSFGQMMVANLAQRNITMPSLEAYKTLLDQKSRLEEFGFCGDDSGREAETIEDIWEKWVPESEKERLDRLEGLDEVEEWQMLARHYAVAWGWRGTSGWEAWSSLRKG